MTTFVAAAAAVADAVVSAAAPYLRVSSGLTFATAAPHVVVHRSRIPHTAACARSLRAARCKLLLACG